MTDALLKQKDAGPQALIFFLGDSSVAQPPWADKAATNIPDLLEAGLQEGYLACESVSVVDWSFPGGRPFHYYCFRFEAEHYSPSLLVIPINWRIFGASSDRWNETFAFPELCASVPINERRHGSGEVVMRLEGISVQRQFLYRLSHPMLYLSGLKIWVQANVGLRVEEKSWQDLRSLLPEPGQLISRFSDTKLFQQYTNHVKGDNSQLQIYRAIAETSVRRGTNILFYITPIHVYEMRARSGFDAEEFHRSTELIKRSVSSANSQCLDLSGLLGENDFIDNFEHYTPEGNRRIAGALASAVHEIVQSSRAHVANSSPSP